jgi:hypothetical protein
VDLEQGVERKANAAEIASGVFYRDHDQFTQKDAAR